jgi:hypothetical protein
MWRVRCRSWGAAGSGVLCPARIGWPPRAGRTPGGFADGSRGHALPSGTDLAALEREITAAMGDGTRMTVDVGGPEAVVLVLNGATLPFAVLCPASGALGPS